MAPQIFNKIGRILDMNLPEKVNSLEFFYCRLKAALYYRHVFKNFGKGTILYAPLLLNHPEYVSIGNNVVIRKGVRMEAIVSDPARPPHLIIGDNVNIEQNVHIICHSNVVIGKEVSITGH